MRRLSKKQRDEMNALRAKHGLLKPDAVLRFAENPKTALHKRFTWDDTQAARLWRLEQAQGLITLVKVEIVPGPGRDPVSVRALVSLDEDRLNGGGYRSIETVMSDAGLRAAALRTAFAELEAMQKRYQHLEELANVFEAVAIAKRRTIAKAQRKQRKVAA